MNKKLRAVTTKALRNILILEDLVDEREKGIDVFKAIVSKRTKQLKEFIAQGGDLNDLRLVTADADGNKVTYKLTALHYLLMGNRAAEPLWDKDTETRTSALSKLYIATYNNVISPSGIQDFPIMTDKDYEFFKFIADHCDKNAEVECIRVNSTGTVTVTQGLSAGDYLIIRARNILLLSKQFEFDEDYCTPYGIRHQIFKMLEYILQTPSPAPTRGNAYTQYLLDQDLASDFAIRPDVIRRTGGCSAFLEEQYENYKDFLNLTIQYEKANGSELFTLDDYSLSDVMHPMWAINYSNYLIYKKGRSVPSAILPAAKVSVALPRYDKNGQLELIDNEYNTSYIINLAYEKLKKASETDELYTYDSAHQQLLNGAGALLVFYTDFGFTKGMWRGHFKNDIEKLEKDGLIQLEKLLINNKEKSALFIKQSLVNSGLNQRDKYFKEIINLYFMYGYSSALCPQTSDDYLALVQNIDINILSYLLKNGIIGANHFITTEDDKSSPSPYVFKALKSVYMSYHRSKDSPEEADKKLVYDIKQTLDLFLSYGLNVNITDEKGTSLPVFILKTMVSCIMLNVTPLRKEGVLDVLSYLSEKGVDFSKKNKYGCDFYDMFRISRKDRKTGEIKYEKRISPEYKPYTDFVRALEKNKRLQKPYEPVEAEEICYEW